MAIHFKSLRNPEMNPDGNIFESDPDFDCTFAELEAEISRVLPGVPKDKISFTFIRRGFGDNLLIMKLD